MLLLGNGRDFGLVLGIFKMSGKNHPEGVSMLYGLENMNINILYNIVLKYKVIPC